MASRDPPDGAEHLNARWVHLSDLLEDYITQIAAIIANLREGDFSGLAQFTKAKNDLVGIARQLRDAEIKIDDQRQRNKGGVPGAGAPIDMDAARDALGSRLDRLRDARRPARAAEVPDGS
ncbi:MAG: hypothetical protein AAFM92_03455 [Pseudomonadota bacterium]